MGVKGLLQALKPIAKEANLSQFRGQRVGIDGYAWLHRASFAALDEVVHKQFSEKPTKYCMKRLLWLKQTYNILPIVVIDGLPLPSKKKTNEARYRSREASKAKSIELAKRGDTTGAYKALGQSVSISWAIVEHFLHQLYQSDIEFIVAPYEADAQLGHLSKIRYIDFVISEDSDLLLYGCTRVCYKLDDAGKCSLIDLADLPQANLLPNSLYCHDSLIVLCAVAGCDYGDGIKGLGLKKAAKHLASVLTEEKAAIAFEPEENSGPPTPMSRIDRLAQHVNVSIGVDQNKIDELKQAYLTFKYQSVYDPIRKRCVRLNDFPARYTEEPYLGPLIPQSDIELLTSGRLVPKTMKPSKLATLPVKCKSTLTLARPEIARSYPSPERAHVYKTPKEPPSADQSAPSSITIASFFKVYSPTRQRRRSQKSLLLKSKTIDLTSDVEQENASPPINVKHASPSMSPQRSKRSLDILFKESMHTKRKKTLAS